MAKRILNESLDAPQNHIITGNLKHNFRIPVIISQAILALLAVPNPPMASEYAYTLRMIETPVTI
jgi:hypothetical protein